MSEKKHALQNEFTEYEFEGKKLLLKTTDASLVQEIFFDFPIRQVIKVGSNILVRLEPDTGSIFNENIYCYSADGAFLWQVQPTNTIDSDCPYTNIIFKENKLFFYNWSGERVLVNLHNGAILKKEFTK